MIDEPDGVVLRFLRRIDEKIDRPADDVRELKTRMTAVEERLAGTEHSIATVNGRIDRVEARLERIERRLDLVAAP
jgi:chromosome segregation ATPase